ncbi:hypothetical protein AA313_de0210136 [Arthrobotrys entomopaga]|nr:hypothetical protein AA313_de0210136 [Arthrobotrys entomopaga]
MQVVVVVVVFVFADVLSLATFSKPGIFLVPETSLATQVANNCACRFMIDGAPQFAIFPSTCRVTRKDSVSVVSSHSTGQHFGRKGLIVGSSSSTTTKRPPCKCDMQHATPSSGFSKAVISHRNAF